MTAIHRPPEPEWQSFIVLAAIVVALAIGVVVGWTANEITRSNTHTAINY